MKKLRLLVVALGLFAAGCAQQTDKPKKTTVAQSQPATVAQSQPATVAPKVKLTLEAAWTKFTAQFDAAVVTGITIERDNGINQFELTGVTKTREVELTLDAVSGKVLHSSEEALDKDEQGVAYEKDAITPDGLEPLTSITKIAVAQVGAGTATEWELEKDNGRTLWTVEVAVGTHQSKVAIDAYSGEILDMKKADD